MHLTPYTLPFLGIVSSHLIEAQSLISSTSINHQPNELNSIAFLNFNLLLLVTPIQSGSVPFEVTNPICFYLPTLRYFIQSGLSPLLASCFPLGSAALLYRTSPLHCSVSTQLSSSLDNHSTPFTSNEPHNRLILSMNSQLINC